MSFCLERLDKKGENPIPLADGTTSLGRHPDNIVAMSADDRCVSAYHAIIYTTPGKLLLQDMQSTNGTYVNGGRIPGERVIKDGDVIGLGWSGPKFRVVRVGDVEADVADVPQNTTNPVNDKPLVSPTITIKRPTVSRPIIPVVIVIVILAVLILVIAFTSGDNSKTKPLPSSQNKFFLLHGEIASDSIGNDIGGGAGVSTDRRIVEERIDAILRRFGEHDYQIPSEMVERVEYYLNQYTGSRKRTIAMFMERRKTYFPMIRRIFTEKNIPLDLAYVSIVESGLDPNAVSHADAMGLWQLMPKTARNYGLEVSVRKDERTDPEKATYAAAAYFKDLIALFGSKSAVMLCMAAYNAGETRIINALKRINDPVNNRDFWYLYKMKWLAEETNEYIPQILALIIISEHPEEYGFD
jgi:hypothetical protein